MKYVIYQASRRGGRSYNEDRVAYAYTPEAMVMVLCDGMGGHVKGEVAAQLTVQVITSLFRSRARPVLPDMTTFLLDAIYAAHDAINEYATRKRLPEPPRTTCVVSVVQKDMACWAHVGDSRLYHFDRQGFLGRTRDHSAVQQLLDDGVIQEAEMGIHPDRNKLYNSVGGFTLPDIELCQPIKLHAGDVLLMCTDGVWPELTPGEMFSTLRAYPLEKAVKNMMDHAEFRGGQECDNLSVVAMRYGEEHYKVDELIQEDDLSLDGFTTQLNKLGAKPNLPPIQDEELEQAMAEIKAAIAKYGKPH
ncbi:MAG TPA: protein phosphatase 2C domain-containing protein [Thiobacillaceae bacterium]|nr:protein phosphatase 2C domain-containing protein [Thiobacillaceae bacterium]HNU64739.1 protein phosphatase 2C domain-containing protein [Thiobacillaceae bacterium]